MIINKVLFSGTCAIETSCSPNKILNVFMDQMEWNHVLNIVLKIDIFVLQIGLYFRNGTIRTLSL